MESLPIDTSRRAGKDSSNGKTATWELASVRLA